MGVATAYDVAALATNSGVLVPAAAGATIRGFALQAVGGNAVLEIHERNATGKFLIPLRLVDGQCVGDSNLELRCDGDVYVKFVSGGDKVTGSIWVA